MAMVSNPDTAHAKQGAESAPVATFRRETRGRCFTPEKDGTVVIEIHARRVAELQTHRITVGGRYEDETMSRTVSGPLENAIAVVEQLPAPVTRDHLRQHGFVEEAEMRSAKSGSDRWLEILFMPLSMLSLLRRLWVLGPKDIRDTSGMRLWLLAGVGFLGALLLGACAGYLLQERSTNLLILAGVGLLATLFSWTLVQKDNFVTVKATDHRTAFILLQLLLAGIGYWAA